MICVAHFGIPNAHACEIVARDARHPDTVFLDEVRRARHLFVSEVANLLFPQELQFRIIEIRVRHHLQRVLEIPADAVRNHP